MINLSHGQMTLLTIFGIVLGVVCIGLLMWSKTSPKIGSKRQAEREREASDRWADARYVKQRGMVVDRKHRDPRRLELGHMGDNPVVNDAYRSALVMAPTGAGKTPRFVVPTVLRHQGPALVGSIKSDVLALTVDHRKTQGPVYVFDPTEARGATDRWSPLSSIHDWSDALDAAGWLQEASAVEGKGIEDRAFWDSQARRLLAPLLLLASQTGCTMADVFEMVSDATSRQQELAGLIAEHSLQAASYWSLFTGLADKTKSSVLATAADVLEPWSHPRMQRAVDVRLGEGGIIDIQKLIDEDGTLYLVAPVSVQSQFTAVYETLVNAVLMEIQNRYHATSLPLKRPFLLMLDEAANIAPLRRLDTVATSMAGMGCITVTVWQNEGQIQLIYGQHKARAIIANHTASIYLAGIGDGETLQALSRTIGTDLVLRESRSTDVNGTRSVSSHLEKIDVAPPEALREMDKDTAIVITSNVRPMRVKLKGWFEDDELRPLVSKDVAAAMDREYASQKRPKAALLGGRRR